MAYRTLPADIAIRLPAATLLLAIWSEQMSTRDGRNPRFRDELRFIANLQGDNDGLCVVGGVGTELAYTSAAVTAARDAAMKAVRDLVTPEVTAATMEQITE